MLVGCLSPLAAGAQEGMVAGRFSEYESHEPQLPVRFEYPADWELEESTGAVETYTQVQLYAPAALEGRMRTYIVVRAVPAKAQGGRYATIEEMVHAYRETLLPAFHIESERTVTLNGMPATSLEMTGTLSLPWQSPRATPVPVRGERVFLAANGRFYELAWLTTPEASSRVTEVFARLLKTLSFLE